MVVSVSVSSFAKIDLKRESILKRKESLKGKEFGGLFLKKIIRGLFLKELLLEGYF